MITPTSMSAPDRTPRWLGSLAAYRAVRPRTGRPRRGGLTSETTVVLSATRSRWLRDGRRHAARSPARRRGRFRRPYLAQTGRRAARGWPPPAAAWYAYAFADGQVRVVRQRRSVVPARPVLARRQEPGPPPVRTLLYPSSATPHRRPRLSPTPACRSRSEPPCRRCRWPCLAHRGEVALGRGRRRNGRAASAVGPWPTSPPSRPRDHLRFCCSPAPLRGAAGAACQCAVRPTSVW